MSPQRGPASVQQPEGGRSRGRVLGPAARWRWLVVRAGCGEAKRRGLAAQWPAGRAARSEVQRVGPKWVSGEAEARKEAGVRGLRHWRWARRGSAARGAGERVCQECWCKAGQRGARGSGLRRGTAGAAQAKGEQELHGPGIEPGPPAWQARILPLNHPCTVGGRRQEPPQARRLITTSCSVAAAFRGAGRPRASRRSCSTRL